MRDAQHPLHALPRGYPLQEYELKEVLGFGGFGMTYRGLDLNLNKAVAIKEYLPSDIATRTADHSLAPQTSEFRDEFQQGLKNFLKEAQTLARFKHPNIIQVHRFFAAHGTAYIVMEYAEGETLAEFIGRKGTLSEAELRAILLPLLDGLEMVHGANLLHRDIKPGNIVIRREDGSPVLLDFGAARQAMGDRSRSVIWTPGYAPIEQHSRQGRQGPWTDIYALGGVCYTALTGQAPADAMRDRRHNDPLVLVSQRCAGQASGAFLSAIDWALAVEVEDRPQSVGAWWTVLEGEETVQVPEAADVKPRSHWGGTVIRMVALLAVALPAYLYFESGLLKAIIGVVALLGLGLVISAGKARKAARLAKDLHTAVSKNASETVEMLLRYGADANAKTGDGATPLHDAAWDNASATAEVLLRYGADVNAKREGFTPLHDAAWNDASDTAVVLLNHGADVNAKDIMLIGVTPLGSAKERNAHQTAEILRRYGGR